MIKRIRFAIVVLLIACYFLNIKNLQSKLSKRTRKIDEKGKLALRESRSTLAERTETDATRGPSVKDFGLIEEDDNNNYNVRGGDERKTLSQLAGGQYQQKKLFGRSIRSFPGTDFHPLLHGLNTRTWELLLQTQGKMGKDFSRFKPHRISRVDSTKP